MSTTDYTKKIPPVLEYQGVKYPTSLTFDPDDCTLKDQILDLLELADMRYAESLSNDSDDDEKYYWHFMLIDAKTLLDAAMDVSIEDRNETA